MRLASLSWAAVGPTPLDVSVQLTELFASGWEWNSRQSLDQKTETF